MVRGESGEDYFKYDLYDIKIADFIEKNDSFIEGNETVNHTVDFKNVNISKVYGHYTFAGSAVVLVMNHTIRFILVFSFRLNILKRHT